MIHTYHDIASSDGDLPPEGKPQLIFSAYLDKGPGFTETARWLFGPSEGGKFFVLWIESDWFGEPGLELSPVVWVAAEENLAEPVWAALLRAHWEAEKKHNMWEEPNFSEIIASKKSLMSPREVQELADSIWPTAKSLE